jgi:hypothetical protein
MLEVVVTHSTDRFVISAFDARCDQIKVVYRCFGTLRKKAASLPPFSSKMLELVQEFRRNFASVLGQFAQQCLMEPGIHLC